MPKRVTDNEFKRRVRQIHGDQFTIFSTYHGMCSKVKIKCNKCGKEFCAWPESLLRKHMGKNCNHKKSNHRSILNFKQASKRLNKISNGEIKLVRFSDMHSVATFECCKCGNVWRATAYNIFYNLTGCPTCSSSKGEKCVRKYLKGKNIPFEEQFKIKKCKDILPLPFDFAVFNADKSLNCLIEYQGCQHFYNPFSWKRSHGPFNTKSVLSTQKHDAMKLSFCKEHGIKLIRINHPQTDSKFDKYSFIANLVKRTLNKELKVS